MMTGWDRISDSVSLHCSDWSVCRSQFSRVNSLGIIGPTQFANLSVRKDDWLLAFAPHPLGNAAE